MTSQRAWTVPCDSALAGPSVEEGGFLTICLGFPLRGRVVGRGRGSMAGLGAWVLELKLVKSQCVHPGGPGTFSVLLASVPGKDSLGRGVEGRTEESNGGKWG